MTDQLHAQRIAGVLQRSQLRISTEAALQTSIRDALHAAGIDAAREMRLGPKDRPDFLSLDPVENETVVIEAKARYGRKAIYRQLVRYAEHDCVRAIVLVTGTAMGMPPAINGKPVYVVSIGLGMLGC
jgi:hypothetical protein